MPQPVTSKPLKDTKIFKPIKVGKVELSNKIVYAPTTRKRALDNHVPSNLQYQYYDERTRFAGSLVISEGTFPTPKTGSDTNVPGIYNEEQVKAWKKINDKIHANGSYSSIQLWGLGRTADPVQTKKEGQKLNAPSAIFYDEESEKACKAAGQELHALTTEEVKDIIYNDYTVAAKNAVAAGFDFVELHGAHGYFIDQFFEPCSNKRTDEYGGSIENRCRFALELIDHLSTVIGADRLAIRISPWATFMGMKSQNDETSPFATYGYFADQLQKRKDKGQEIAYLSVVEPRVSGIINIAEDEQYGDNGFLKIIWKGVIMKAGNYTYDAPEFKTAIQDVDDDRTLVGFSRYITSNPDFWQKLHDGKELTPYDRDTFYYDSNWGYNTFAFDGEDRKVDEKKEKANYPQPIA